MPSWFAHNAKRVGKKTADWIVTNSAQNGHRYKLST
jgi:hypothetical protein